MFGTNPLRLLVVLLSASSVVVSAAPSVAAPPPAAVANALKGPATIDEVGNLVFASDIHEQELEARDGPAVEIGCNSIDVGGRHYDVVDGHIKRRRDLSDIDGAVDLDERGDAADLASAWLDIINRIIKLAEAKKREDHRGREQLLKDGIDRVAEGRPNSNIFIYHQFTGKTHFWGIEDPNVLQSQITWKRKDVPNTTEYFNVVSFYGKGELENTGDGGWANWGFSGHFDREGSSKVHFH